jgi:hypothetical protein
VCLLAQGTLRNLSKENIMKKFYTYLWLREDGTPYYVGKGSGKRAFTRHRNNAPPPKSLARILVQHWESEEKAFEMEKWWISLFGRKDNGTGVLRNLTDGGENPPSAVTMWETRDRSLLSELMKGNTYASALKGTHQSWERIRNRVEARKKNGTYKQSEETKKKIGESIKALGLIGEKNPFFGKKHSEEYRIKRSKLKDSQISEVLSLLQKGMTQVEVGKRFGVGQPHISRIFLKNKKRAQNVDKFILQG